MSGGRKWKVTPIKPNWQVNWTYYTIHSCWKKLSFEERLARRRLLTWTDCFYGFRFSEVQTRISQVSAHDQLFGLWWIKRKNKLHKKGGKFKCENFTNVCAGLHAILYFYGFKLSPFVICFSVGKIILFWQNIKIRNLC